MTDAQVLTLCIQITGAVVTVLTFALAVHKLANAKGRAHETASNSLALAKSLEIQSATGQTKERLATAAALREKLLARGHYASQLYLDRSEPVVTHWLQVVFIAALTVTYSVYFLNLDVPEGSVDFTVLLVQVTGLVGGGTVWRMSVLVLRHKATERSLRTHMGTTVSAEERRTDSLRRWKNLLAARGGIQ